MAPIVSFLISMIPGTLALSGDDILVKKLLSRDVSERLLLLFVWGGSGALLAALALLLGLPEIGESFWRAVIATSSLNVFGQFAWYRAFKYAELSLIAPLRLLIPPFVIGTGFLFLDEVPTSGGVAGILLTLAGLWFLLVPAYIPEANVPGLSPRESGAAGDVAKMRTKSGVFWGLAACAAFAFAFPFDKQAVLASSALSAGAAIHLFVAFGSAALFVFLEEDAAHRVRTVLSEWRLLVPAVILDALGAVLVLHALNFALASYAASVKRLQAFWTVAFSGAFLKEGNIKRKLFAVLLMLAGVAVTVLFG